MDNRPSISNLSALPAPAELQRRLRACAVLDVIMMDDEFMRGYEFHPKWSKDATMAAFKTGGGDEIYALFKGDDAIMKGFDHESEVSPYGSDEHEEWPGVYDGVPSHLNALLNNGAIMRDDVTFCAWCTGGVWAAGPVEFPDGEDDGSGHLMPTMTYDAAAYVAWAKDYYEVELDLTVVEGVFRGEAVTEDIERRLNPERDAAAAVAEAQALGSL